MRVKFLLLVFWFFCNFASNAYALALLYSCNFGTIGTLNFGFIPASVTSAISATTQFTVTCTNLLSLGATSISYTITATPGNSGNQASRRMILLTNIITYNMYTDSGNSQIFGSGTGGSGTFSASYSLNALTSRTDTFRIYGLIPIQSIASLGIYNDSITLTLTY